jgi:hypothetical protein
MLDLNVAILHPSERLKSLPKHRDAGLYFRIVLPSECKNTMRAARAADPPVGGHSCNGGMIPRFHRAVSN